MRTVKTHDQTGRMPRLIRVVAGCTGHFVGFIFSSYTETISSDHYLRFCRKAAQTHLR